MYVPYNDEMDKQQDFLPGYKDVKIFKTQKLGVGSYGAVYKASCDQLPCAAKLLHPTLITEDLQEGEGGGSSKDHRKPLYRFRRECQFLSQFRHPNIIQYIGVCLDSTSNLPALLMELMDESLTDFLDRHSLKPLPFHVAFNICQDVALAISFLHANNIWHRDLSSNNILMLGDRRAKVTDFGMAKMFSELTGGSTKTAVPGTSAYMPPESIDETPEYSEKIDIFSYGVLLVQIVSGKCPKPSKRMRSIPGGRMYQKVSEAERRKEHIGQIASNHPLLPLALDCIADSECDRPSATDVVKMLHPIKSSSLYTSSKKSTQEQEKAWNQLVQESSSSQDTISRLLAKFDEREYAIAALEKKVQDKERELRLLQRSHNITVDDLKAENEAQATRFKDRMSILERLLEEARDTKYITMTTQESSRAPRAMYRMSNAVVNGDVIYFAITGDVYEDAIYSLNLAEGGVWSSLPSVDEQRRLSTNTIAVVGGSLITVGGSDEDENVTNQLFTFVANGNGIHEGKWEEQLPPMKHERDNSIAVTHGNHLVVAGGVSGADVYLFSVEVLNTSSFQWSEATPLSEPLSSASATVCAGSLYLLGGWASEKTPTSAVYKCSIADLIKTSGSASSAQSGDLWKKMADLPVLKTTAVSYRGHLIAMGGVDVMNRATTIVQRYDKASDSWIVIGHLMVPRGQPFAVALPRYDVTMVIGGHKGYYINKIYEVEEVCFNVQN